MDSASASRSNTKGPASRSHPRPRHRGVRVVAKIRSFPKSEMADSPDGGSCSSVGSQISISRPSGDSPSIVFGDHAASRKDSCKLDQCYGQDEGSGEIFSREVMPLLKGVFDGHNVCVIAYGAKGSGKTHLIQGSEENPGLAPMAVSEVFLSAEKIRSSVHISCYEVYQDRVYDLLEPNGQEVLVLKDAGHKIQLKGLSMVLVKSISEFNEVYFHGCSQRKGTQKAVNDVTVKSHRGLIVYVFEKESNNGLIGKINFVDLAGYEDIKKNSNDRLQIAENVKVNKFPSYEEIKKNSNDRLQLAESAKINKSLYELLNVVRALNTDEIYVPYRENKLTRLLQDFLCGGNEAVLITCLDPTLCQDTINAVSWASRSCRASNQHRQDSSKPSKSVSKFAQSCSPTSAGKRTGNTSVLSSIEEKINETPSMIKRAQPIGISVKKPVSIKRRATLSIKKGGSLFDMAGPFTNLMENVISSCEATIVNTSKEENGLFLSEVSEPSISEEDVSLSSERNCLRGTDIGEMHSQPLYLTYSDSRDTDIGLEENQISLGNTCESSAPLTERLREISNSLKLLNYQPLNISAAPLNISAAPLNISAPQGDVSGTRQVSMDPMDPRTPDVSHLKIDDNSRYENTGTPHDIFKARSTGLKDSLVQECLAYLNNANKEELKNLKGIGEKRADYIIQLREDDPKHFKEIDDIKEIGLSSKQIREMMTMTLGDF